MEADLGAYLEEAASWSVVIGERDCMLFVADWWARLTGKDPAAPWRGRYSTEAGAARIIARAGGMKSLLGDGLAVCGGVPVDPRRVGPGNVGLVLRPVAAGRTLMGAIKTPSGWAVLSDAGLWVSPGGAVAAWGAANG